MKVIIRKGLTLIMFVAIATTLSVSASATTVSVANVTIGAGETITVPIMINDVTNLGAATIDLNYNPSVVHVTSVSNSQFTTIIPNINNSTGFTRITAFQIGTGLTGNIKLADVALRAVGSSGQSSSLNLSITTLKTTGNVPIPATTVNGVFTIRDLTPPASISNLQNTTGNFWINWSWNNPPDPDFSHTTVFINGGFITNTSLNYYNITLSPHATREIATRTVDTSGNINAAWVNQTTQVANNIPVLTAIGNKVINENQLLTIALSAGDADGDVLAYSTNRTDLFSDFNTATGRGNWTPSFIQAGIYYVNFGVSDGFGGAASETIQIIVNNVNRQPSIVFVAADKTAVVVNEQFNVTVTAIDPDADDTLQYQFDWQNNGSWSSNQSSNTASHSYPAVGNYNINVRVWDNYGAGAANSSLNITVTQDNVPPNVGSPSANPSEILLEEANNADYQHMSTRLNVTVTDPNGVSSVTINLSSIGGLSAQPMTNIGGNIWSAATNATGLSGNKLLGVNATDIYGNSNKDVNITLSVVKNGDVNSDGVTDVADAMWLANNIAGSPGFGTINELASEVNGDGIIDVADAMYIANYIAGTQGFNKLY